eukprot:364784-Chlamydomonas_euryale.AAC.13
MCRGNIFTRPAPSRSGGCGFDFCPPLPVWSALENYFRPLCLPFLSTPRRSLRWGMSGLTQSDPFSWRWLNRPEL